MHTSLICCIRNPTSHCRLDFLTDSILFHLRKRDDLIMTHSVGITEALCGFQMVFQHLDGRDIVVTHLPGEVRYRV